MTPERLRRRLRGDLDNIVAKALKKEPRERYASVTAFADDLRRYLANQPVSARPDSFAYRATKFVQRNRLPVALSSLAAAATLAGLAGTILQWRHAAEQRDFALRQVARVEAVNDLTGFLLYNAAPSGKPFTAPELLARGEKIVERETSNASRSDLLVAIGRDYSTLDAQADGQRVLARAYALSRSDPDPAVRTRAACAWARALAYQGEREESERIYAEALAALPDQAEYRYDRIDCLLLATDAALTLGENDVGVQRADGGEAAPSRPAVCVAGAGAEGVAGNGGGVPRRGPFQESRRRVRRCRTQAGGAGPRRHAAGGDAAQQLGDCAGADGPAVSRRRAAAQGDRHQPHRRCRKRRVADAAHQLCACPERSRSQRRGGPLRRSRFGRGARIGRRGHHQHVVDPAGVDPPSPRRPGRRRAGAR